MVICRFIIHEMMWQLVIIRLLWQIASAIPPRPTMLVIVVVMVGYFLPLSCTHLLIRHKVSTAHLLLLDQGAIPTNLIFSLHKRQSLLLHLHIFLRIGILRPHGHHPALILILTLSLI